MGGISICFCVFCNMFFTFKSVFYCDTNFPLGTIKFKVKVQREKSIANPEKNITFWLMR